MQYDNEENTKEEEENMATLAKPQKAMMIEPGKTKAFADMLASHKRPDNYWEGCAGTSKAVSSSTMDKLKKMCNGEE